VKSGPFIAGTAAALLVVTPQLARATDPIVSLGARVGYGVPMGGLLGNGPGTSHIPLDDVFSGIIPMGLDLEYWVNRNVAIGAYSDFGAVRIRNGGTAGDLQMGAMMHYHASPNETVDPWVGIGSGYEVLWSYFGGYPARTHGWQFLTLLVGADYAASQRFGFGPFASCSFGRFTYQNGEAGLGTIKTPVMHEWLVFGVHGTYGFGNC